MREHYDLVIIGAGPAGLGAANEALKVGIDAIVIDMYPKLGGQYYKQLPSNFLPDGLQKKDPIISSIESSNINIIYNTTAWGIFPDDGVYDVGLFSPETSVSRIKAKKIIIASGAYDRPVPFPGWTLPGVITAGAAMNLIKNQRLLPGKRILLSGTGPLQIILAKNFIGAGAESIHVLDINPFPVKGIAQFSKLWGQWERIIEGFRALHTMTKAGVKIRWSYSIIGANGKDQVESAEIGNLDGRVSEQIRVDLICLGFGFLPSIQLASQSGCEFYYHRMKSTYLPIRDELLQSTQPGIFIAGDCGGIGGKDVAFLEGRLTVAGVAMQLGYSSKLVDEKFIKNELLKQRKFIGLLDQLFPSNPGGVWLLMTNETIICRCEDVTLSDIKQVIADGATSVSQIKNITRAGMGRCQGRMCGLPTLQILAKETGKPPEEYGYHISHPPVFPIPLTGLLDKSNY